MNANLTTTAQFAKIFFSETFEKVCAYFAVETAALSLNGEEHGFKFVAVSAFDKYQMYVPELKLRFEKAK